jgi:GNAT superfamily N-acetyltransferase
MSNVLCMSVERPLAEEQSPVSARLIGPEEAQLWSDISARGWSHEHPEIGDFLRDLGALSAAREDSLCFLAEHDGTPGAAGVLCLHDGVALFGGSATVPELRRRGLQAALLHKRMGYAFDHGCNLAMIVVEPGGDSQRNAERQGFEIAYTRTKWRLFS